MSKFNLLTVRSEAMPIHIFTDSQAPESTRLKHEGSLSMMASK